LCLAVLLLAISQRLLGVSIQSYGVLDACLSLSNINMEAGTLRLGHWGKNLENSDYI